MTSADPMGMKERDVEWLLESLRDKTPAVRHVLVLSKDGLRLSFTSGLTIDQADHLAAIASGIQSLAISASAEFGPAGVGAGQSMVEFPGGLLLIVPAGDGAHLTVIADDEADVGLIGHNMNELVEQIGGYLTAAPRHRRPGTAP
ncbi:MAG TPA: roadblock/LC7 domain-containing protein [Streptosporangiaceae bacterium]|nr:roadblock/LC7 domain-containing protein [Streptosporangiaceae bacterium]